MISGGYKVMKKEFLMLLEHQHDDGCGCGHDHDHEGHAHEHSHEEHEHHHHDHDDECGCGCGHDHDHEEHEHHHHHDHDDECGCGHDHHHDHEEHEHHHHDHDDECGCGHDHHHDHEEHEHHHHEHGDSCGCGHDHGHDHGHDEHDHEHGDECGCGHHHEGVNAHGKRVYILENLGCANCAAKMEKRINELPGVAEATITYATKQLRITAENYDALLPQIQDICSSIESEVKVVPKETSNGLKTKVYIVENLDCANCAAKIERKINELDEVNEAVLTYTTQQLRITAANPDRILPKIKEVCAIVEPDAVIKEMERKPSAKKEEEKKFGMTAEQRTIASIAVGAVLFILMEVLEHVNMDMSVLLPFYVIAYAVLGWRVVLTAVRNMGKGQIFDENFLMSIATLGAFAIKSYPEAVGVMLFYRIGEFFEEKAVERSRGQIMEAVDLRPETVNLVENGETRVIAAEDAVPGDIILVRPGDRIPLDGVVIDGDSRIDTSPITGEPVPVHVAVNDEVTSGCVNTSGQLTIRVEKPLGESMVTRILDSVENAAASKPKVDRFITKFSRVYTPIVVFLALGTALLPPLVGGGEWHYWIYTALSFLVMSCPCALVLSVPLAFFSGIGAGSKKGILFKGGVALEALADVKAVVMDKTGTITEGNFVLQKAVSAGTLSEDELLQITASCEQNSTHPIAVSIVTAAKEKGMQLSKPSTLKEIAGEGILAVIDGKAVLCGNRKLMEHHNVNLSAYQNDVFGTEVLVAVEGEYAGYLTISDTIKADAKSAIAALKKQGITTAMLTGDAQNSAEAVAKETGIDEVHAKLLPQDKLSELQKIRSQHEHVMFVGDGINDAPVLAGADVGAAMGSGADAAIEAADVVYMTSSMTAIPDSMKIAKAAVSISWQNIVFALAIKVIVMILGLCGFASMWMAVFADTGVAMLCVLNSIRVLYKK